ncbi:hypothetical protein D3C80_2007380 [compost metagenome]
MKIEICQARRAILHHGHVLCLEQSLTGSSGCARRARNTATDHKFSQFFLGCLGRLTLSHKLAATQDHNAVSGRHDFMQLMRNENE